VEAAQPDMSQNFRQAQLSTHYIITVELIKDGGA